MQQSEKQQPQQHSSSNAAAAKRQRPRSNIRIQRLSLSRFVRELSTAIHSRGSVATCIGARATKEFSEVFCCSTNHFFGDHLCLIWFIAFLPRQVESYIMGGYEVQRLTVAVPTRRNSACSPRPAFNFRNQ